MSTQTSYVMVSKYISEDRSPEEAAASRRLEPSSQITRTAVMVGPLETWYVLNCKKAGSGDREDFRT